MHGTACGCNRGGDEVAGGVKHGVATDAGCREVDAGLAHHHALDASSGKDGNIDRAQPLARPAQWLPGAEIVVDRQHALAARDWSKSLMAAVAAEHDIERGNGVGAGRESIPDLDSRGRRCQARGRIGAGIGGRFGAHGKAIAQGACGRGAPGGRDLSRAMR